MVYFRNRLPKSVVNDYNEQIVRNRLRVIRSSASNDHDDNSSQVGGTISAGDQQVGSDKASPDYD